MDSIKSPDDRPITEEANFLKLKNVDHVHFWVGNAKHAMFYWWKGFGFKPVAYSGLETGNRQFASYLLESGNARLVLSAPYSPSSEISGHHLAHGDGIKAIAFEVDDVEQAYQATTSRGARSEWTPKEEKDDDGTYITAAIQTYGEVIHIFVERKAYKGIFAPTYQPIDYPHQDAGIRAIDHIVGNVQLGKMNYWVNWYHQVMGFRQLMHFDDKDISTEYSALMSKVMENGSGRIKFPINEPAEGKRISQIEEYLEYYRGPGSQHIAMITGNILETMEKLHANGIEFLRVPNEYYDLLPDRVGEIEENLELIKKLGILVDKDDEGYLLQVFTKPIQDRPTSFIEVIQRKGSRGFGKGNFKALFESLEYEQERRGNL
ncbi:MAG: 4-hydroxyphenylpyruvate dioxygenase [Chloroflexi bacterium]|jgi:4-hydroxyphenylpyruvate dioxygenase|nr:4-hydroxyphenylpyruvate dioxygenase [Chloroflexota bacterium]MBT3670520.1 4-hydroxyphenylpyruvate dioxygenase [Chloroflexota bacterium]MBT4304453.1 4-hydroxyphenylpyruvate dioxygenase [Chloroflexota bacterium]MBT4532580.1 4-hydroxyphenylpyruvate dioxygenase [Chloroflexota bacterium]MBT4754371.1 4-hydroxyphenylpyruvate dioxygenase [Chloroflexota bacterium]